MAKATVKSYDRHRQNLKSDSNSDEVHKNTKHLQQYNDNPNENNNSSHGDNPGRRAITAATAMAVAMAMATKDATGGICCAIKVQR